MPPFRRTLLLRLLSGLFLVCLFLNMVSVVDTTHRDVAVMKFKLGFAEARLDYQVRLISQVQQQVAYLHRKIDRVDDAARRRHHHPPPPPPPPRRSGLADLFRKLLSSSLCPGGDDDAIRQHPKSSSSATISGDNNFDATNPGQNADHQSNIESQTKTQQQQQPSVDNDTAAETRDSYYMPKLFVPM